MTNGWEEEDFETRKDAKKQRRLAIDRDRSKYKKTDRKKFLKSVDRDQEFKRSKQEWLEGRVLSIVPQGILIDFEGEKISCTVKGLLKKDKTQAKNLVTVGDFVLFEKINPGEGIIGQVKPRQTVLSRADNLSRRKEQLIAANIDQVIITASVVNPPLKAPIIDRYIIATQKGEMQPIIVINKIDLFQNLSNEEAALVEAQKEIYEELIEAYKKVDIQVIGISAFNQQGIEELKGAMKQKASVFSGQSGVGKSSLINTLTGSDLRVGLTVDRTKKGSHTTTTAQLIPLSFGGWCIDTPGIKSFGIWDLNRDEIEGYFQEIQEIGRKCKFINCTHSHEEQCEVIEALKRGELSPLRFDSYQALMHSMSQAHIRR